MRRNLLLLLLWLAGLLAVDAQTLSRKEVETYVINQYGKRWKDIALYLGEKDTLDKDNALTFEKTISVRGKSKLITRVVIPLIVSIFALLCVATSKMNRSN